MSSPRRDVRADATSDGRSGAGTRPEPESERFTYSVVASVLHDRGAVDRITRPVRATLDALGGRPVDEAPRDPSPHLYLVATGGTERTLLDAIDDRRRHQPAEPALLLAHGAHNSLPAALEALAALGQRHRRGRIAFLAGDDSDPDIVDEAVSDLEAVHRLRRARLGLVGGPSDWLVASSPDLDTVTRRWGPTIEVVEPDRVLVSIGRAQARRTHELADRYLALADPATSTVDAGAVRAAAAVGTALTDVADEVGLSALSVRCFDLLHEPGTSGCLALATLNDDGVVAGCEGDLPSTLAMMWVRALLDLPAWMANPARVDVDHDRIVLAHCTVAPSMTESLSLSTHFESGIGVGIAGRFAVQPVTLLRLGGVDLDRQWIAQGHIVATGDDPDLCRTQVTVELEDRAASDLLNDPLGNHVTLVAGHHRARLERWWSLAVE